jgi:hypothetical protein
MRRFLSLPEWLSISRAVRVILNLFLYKISRL